MQIYAEQPRSLGKLGYATGCRAAFRWLAGWLAGCQPSHPASHPEALRLAQIPFSPSWSSSFDPRLPKIRILDLEYDDHVVRTVATPSRCQPFWPNHDVTSLLTYSYIVFERSAFENFVANFPGDAPGRRSSCATSARTTASATRHPRTSRRSCPLSPPLIA